jgi:hypothetical protein
MQRRTLGGFWTPNWVTQQTVIFADGRTRVRNVHCLGEKNGVRAGEVWIGDRMARVTEVKFGFWREERPEGVSPLPARRARVMPPGYKRCF